jgi:aminoglycoside phosphotransferase (APT) family kinase protein
MACFRLPLLAVLNPLMHRAPLAISDQQRWGVQEVFDHLQLRTLKTFVPMAAGKMHVDEVDTDAGLVQRLLAAQFPQWADLPLEPLQSSGTDSALYRLGDDKVVRLPRIQASAGQVDKENQWLPRLAPLVTLPIPAPLAKGTPGEGFPWSWSVYRWIEGEIATIERIANLREAATDMARFIAALHGIDSAGGPAPGHHNSFRGVPLATRDAATRAAISNLRETLDEGALTAAWDAALNASVWSSPPVWIHGDLQPGNLLIQDGRLNAVIDFGCLGVGDPACDLIVAWNLFNAESREVLRAALKVEEATWKRGRGWALSVGLIALPYYEHSNATLAAVSRYAVHEVLADSKFDT